MPSLSRIRSNSELIRLQIGITDWQWEQSYGLNPFTDGEPYVEGRYLGIVGTVPDKKGDKLAVELTIYAVEPIDFSKPRLHPVSLSVGGMSRVKGGYDGKIFLPEHAAPMVVTSLAAGKYQVISLYMMKKSRLTYDIHSYSFKRRSENCG